MGVGTSVQFNYKGRDLTLFYMSVMCKATGRNAQTLRKWENNGIIPKTPFRDKTGKRLYLKEHIDAVVDCMKIYNVGQGRDISATNFRATLFKRFDKINKKYLFEEVV